jgi:two-component sensor histidine kinase
MAEWLTPLAAVVLMYTGVLPSLATVYLLYDDRRQPGVLWFLLSMATGGLWAFLFATFTLVPSPGVTLALANVFWALVPTAAVTMFLLAYEYVFKAIVSRRVVALLFAPVLVLFVLSWVDPADLVFTSAYRVDPDGFLRFPALGGPVKILVTQVYGYLLVFLAAGMFVGEAMRSSGIRRRQTIYLLFVFSMLVCSTVVKVVGLVPFYFDPTSVVYSLSGLLFAHSIDRHGLFKFASVAREQAFQDVGDAILVVSPDGVVVEVNRSGSRLFETEVVGESLEAVLASQFVGDVDETARTVQMDGCDGSRYFSVRTSAVDYGRGLTGRLVVLSDISALKRRQNELDLLRQILTRVFRHNVRNDLTVIEGYASLIEDEGDERAAELAEKIHEPALRLLERAEKAQQIEKVFAQEDPVERSLRAEVERAIEPYVSRPDVRVESSVDDVPVAAHPQFGVALTELVENGIRHHDSPDPPEIEFSSELDGDRVVLIVEDRGPGIPDQEIEVLDAKEETDLRHSSGIGLWLVDLIVTRVGGDLRVESKEDGTRFEIALRRADEGGERA